MTLKKLTIVSALVFATTLTSACSTRGVVDGTVNTAGFVAKTAVNGTIGAGRLAVNAVAGSDE